MFIGEYDSSFSTVGTQAYTVRPYVVTHGIGTQKAMARKHDRDACNLQQRKIYGVKIALCSSGTGSHITVHCI
jgi:mannose/fructose/N-acetylgalactosamine-specific phosphotransferase system component IID